MGEDVLVFAVLTTGAVLIIAHAGRLLRAMVLHKTIREAISRDNAAALPDLLKGIDEPQSGTGNDDRSGLVLIALGLALLLFALIQGDPDDLRTMGGAALFPAFVGAALLARYFWARNRERLP